MQGIYTYIPETNYVPREYSVAAILLLLFMVLISLVSVLNLLYFYISTFRSMCAVPNMAVFWSSLTSCFPGMLLTYFLNYYYYYYYYYCMAVNLLYLDLNQKITTSSSFNTEAIGLLSQTQFAVWYKTICDKRFTCCPKLFSLKMTLIVVDGYTEVAE